MLNLVLIPKFLTRFFAKMKVVIPTLIYNGLFLLLYVVKNQVI